ncbi:MAG: hypothetical protein J6Q38_04080 [Clostridia bacterium]|nr:hypothetical protein [Clostridia bacterium]
MKISHGIKISTANKTLWFKTMIAKLAVIFIFIAIIYSVATAVIKPILESLELKNLVACVREIVSDFIVVNNDDMSENGVIFKDATLALLSFIQSRTASFIWAGVGIVILIQVAKFILSMFDYVIGVNINEHMSSMLHAGFFGTLFENFKPAICYAGFRTLLIFGYNIITCGLLVTLFVVFVDSLGILSLTVVLLLLFVLIALRLMVSGLILPIMICENVGVIVAVKESFKYYQAQDMFNRFLAYFITSFCVYVVIFVAGVVSFNVGYILLVPFASIIFKTLRFVDYYTIKSKKYYITFDEIVIPKELRQNDEQLLNKVDI